MKKVLLSFDIEEFDMPLEYGKSIPLEEQIRISKEGTRVILDILHRNKIRATFFSTVVFASHAPELIDRLVNEGHELASHGYFHSQFQNKHLLESRDQLQKLSGKRVDGFRMPRMMPVNDQEIKKAGYKYNSSLNPVYLPGRYNNFFKPRIIFKSNEVFQLPASATPIIRLPLFWLSFHNLPLWLYKSACLWTINRDLYLNIYFHPWEFINLAKSNYGLPKIVTRKTGAKMAVRFSHLIDWMKSRKYGFSTIKDFLLYDLYIYKVGNDIH
ncbi:polysaccharide deacetylase family protein [Chryseolinea sp. H1M3-3]|uniref:polysaccharide deacetylase family protein n=1 Tax=Chryseolinea sp. H1M3-3 TaxID=3034144 RepID=UPI0023ED223E|nr:polysaccharide deacetylase family protein [Chryseolinea sp. H1M3-3]